jgi:hypothetical protein
MLRRGVVRAATMPVVNDYLTRNMQRLGVTQVLSRAQFLELGEVKQIYSLCVWVFSWTSFNVPQYAMLSHLSYDIAGQHLVLCNVGYVGLGSKLMDNILTTGDVVEDQNANLIRRKRCVEHGRGNGRQSPGLLSTSHPTFCSPYM